MKNEESKALETLLLRCAEENRDPDGPELAAAFGDDAEGLRKAQEWLRTQAAYTELAQDEERLVETLCRDEDAIDDLTRQRDRRTVETFFAERTTKPRAPRLRPGFPTWQLVAGLLLLVGAGFWIAGARGPEADEGSADGDAPLMLGNRPLADLRPNGPVPAFGSFTWEALELPPGGGYRIVVECLGREILRTDGLKQASFEATPEQRAELNRCKEIAWRVYALSADARGAPLAAGSAVATRE